MYVIITSIFLKSWNRVRKCSVNVVKVQEYRKQRRVHRNVMNLTQVVLPERKSNGLEDAKITMASVVDSVKGKQAPPARSAEVLRPGK